MYRDRFRYVVYGMSMRDGVGYGLVWQASPSHAHEGLVSCVYATCSAAARSAAPIRLLHIIINLTGLSQASVLTNQVLDLHVEVRSRVCTPAITVCTLCVPV